MNEAGRKLRRRIRKMIETNIFLKMTFPKRLLKHIVASERYIIVSPNAFWNCKCEHLLDRFLCFFLLWRKTTLAKAPECHTFIMNSLCVKNCPEHMRLWYLILRSTLFVRSYWWNINLANGSLVTLHHSLSCTKTLAGRFLPSGISFAIPLPRRFKEGSSFFVSHFHFRWKRTIIMRQILHSSHCAQSFNFHNITE